nr:peptidyl-prolyl cis-trans isomerase FKBP11 [Zootoca vivipara]
MTLRIPCNSTIPLQKHSCITVLARVAEHVSLARRPWRCTSAALPVPGEPLARSVPPSFLPSGRGSGQQGAAPGGGTLPCGASSAAAAQTLWATSLSLSLSLPLPLAMLPLRFGLVLVLLCGAGSRAQRAEDEPESPSESALRALQLETLVEPPDDCAERSAVGDTLHIHYTGTLEDGRVIDSSLSRDPLQVELGKRQVIPGLEQGLLDMCVGEKRRVLIPPHLAYGKRGSPPAVPADAALQFEVELVGLSRATYWQKMLNVVLPLLCIGLVPALLGLIGYHLYQKARAPRVSKKKLKEEKRNKAKKK